MLDKLDLTRTLDKAEYKRRMPVLAEQLLAYQQAGYLSGLPVIILFEGWDAAGKGTSIRKLAASLDPRGFRLYPIRAPRSFEQKRPWMWRFWSKIPAQGEWVIFDHSWYRRITVDRMSGSLPESEWRLAYRDIVDFERTLADDGYLIFKFFLHISQEEQRLRFEKINSNPKIADLVTLEDWDHHRRYSEWVPAYEEALERTDTEWAPWTIVEASDKRFTRIRIFETLVAGLEAHLPNRKELQPIVVFDTASSELLHEPEASEHNQAPEEKHQPGDGSSTTQTEDAPEEAVSKEEGEVGSSFAEHG